MLSWRIPKAFPAAAVALMALTCVPQNYFSVSITATAQVTGNGALTFDNFTTISLVDIDVVKSQGITHDELSSVTLLDFSLRIDDPNDKQDLTLLTQVNVYVHSPGQNPLLIAAQPTFTAGDKYALLTVQAAELAPYFKSTQASISVQATVVAPASAVSLTAHPNFMVHVPSTQPICSR